MTLNLSIEDTDYYYITDEHLGIAKKNGIKEATVWSRVRLYGWSIQRAITEVPKKRKTTGWNKWKQVALSNGICYETFVTRVHRGMTAEESATTSPLDETESLNRARKTNIKFPDEYYERAKKNGISRENLYQRVTKCGWSLEDACTIPIVKNNGDRLRVGKRCKNKE